MKDSAVLVRGGARSCGSCSLCCKVAIIPELSKPGGMWCKHAKPGAGGCSIYGEESRPKVCRTFTCAWVESDAMPEALRPDRVHAYISGLKTGDGISVHVDTAHPDAWRTGALGEFVKRMSSRGVKVVVAVGAQRYAIIKGKLFGMKDTRDFLHGKGAAVK